MCTNSKLTSYVGICSTPKICSNRPFSYLTRYEKPPKIMCTKKGHFRYKSFCPHGYPPWRPFFGPGQAPAQTNKPTRHGREKAGLIVRIPPQRGPDRGQSHPHQPPPEAEGLDAGCSGEHRRPTASARSAATVSLKCRMGETRPLTGCRDHAGHSGLENGAFARIALFDTDSNCGRARETAE